MLNQQKVPDWNFIQELHCTVHCKRKRCIKLIALHMFDIDLMPHKCTCIVDIFSDLKLRLFFVLSSRPEISFKFSHFVFYSGNSF